MDIAEHGQGKTGHQQWVTGEHVHLVDQPHDPTCRIQHDVAIAHIPDLGGARRG